MYILIILFAIAFVCHIESGNYKNGDFFLSRTMRYALWFGKWVVGGSALIWATLWLDQADKIDRVTAIMALGFGVIGYYLQKINKRLDAIERRLKA